MFNHFVHRNVLQKLAILVAVLAVVEVGTAIRIRSAVLILSERHAATLTELWELSLLESFFLFRER